MSPPSTVPSAPLPVTALSTKSWRSEYPRIGQFVMTENDEIIAAVPGGLLNFKRVNDHVSKPWSEGRLLPNTAMLHDSSVTGLAAALIDSKDPRLYVFCVSGGTLYIFNRSTKDRSSWVNDCYSPFSEYAISGTPAVASSRGYRSGWWNLAIPCQSGGLLHTSTDGSSSYYSGIKAWEPVDHVAKSLGIISSVSIATIYGETIDWDFSREKNGMVMVCIASGRLYTADGELSRSSSGYTGNPRWEAQAPTRIRHPGKVTGNPILFVKDFKNQLDLLVPSAVGGVFHFVRTASTPDKWHMIARIGFPQGLPTTSCLAVHSERSSGRRHFRAMIQSGGRLYYVTTTESYEPWSGSFLRPIVSPGPFSG